MNRTELEELIRNGENSGVDFKRDDVVPERLAKELAALLNLEGGVSSSALKTKAPLRV